MHQMQATRRLFLVLLWLTNTQVNMKRTYLLRIATKLVIGKAGGDLSFLN
jgi:hypothetical protein